VIEVTLLFRARGLLAGLAVLALTSCATTKQASPKWYELTMMADPILDQVLLFYLGEAWTGMTDINECLQTASRVEKDDPDSWTREWRKTAERLQATADRLARRGKPARVRLDRHGDGAAYLTSGVMASIKR
jgi:hypothetical protein